MTTETTDRLSGLDLVIPSSRAVEYHLARVEADRDLLLRQLEVSREREARLGRQQTQAAGSPVPP